MDDSSAGPNASNDDDAGLEQFKHQPFFYDPKGFSPFADVDNELESSCTPKWGKLVRDENVYCITSPEHREAQMAFLTVSSRFIR